MHPTVGRFPATHAEETIAPDRLGRHDRPRPAATPKPHRGKTG
ncbi:MAG: hypothetical protein ACAF42_16275 [Limnothrix sp. BL-A-16]